MKKVYQKPVLLKEKFQMEEMIATCEVINTNLTEGDQCNYSLPSLAYPLFVNGWESCFLFIEDYQESGLDTLCKAPGANNLWSS